MTGPVITSFGKMAQNEERWRGYLRRIRSGDRQGLAQLYDETCGVIYGLALRILDDPTAAADLVLEVYEHVWSSPQAVEAAGSVLGALTTLTRRRVPGQFRKSITGAERENLPAALPAPESVLGQERRLVIRALSLLDPAQREVIELAFFSGMKDIQLAQALGVSPQLIRARISTGMRKLNEALRLVSSAEGNA